MPVCSKCRQREATVHWTTVVNGAAAERIDLCAGCAGPTGYENLTPTEVEALSLEGKVCELCGAPAASGTLEDKRPIYWCPTCARERAFIVRDLLSERGEGIKKHGVGGSTIALLTDPELRGLLGEIDRQATGILRGRHSPGSR